MRYQQLTSHAYCRAAGPVSKMASQQEKAFCVLRFEVSSSVITVITVHKTHTALQSQIWIPRNGAHRKPFPAATPSWKLAPQPCSKHEKQAAGSTWDTWPVTAADGVRCARARWEINFLLTFETAPFFCVFPVLGSHLLKGYGVVFPVSVVIVVLFCWIVFQNWKLSGYNRVLIRLKKFIYVLSPDGGDHANKVAAAAASRARLCYFTWKPSAELVFMFIAFLSVTCYAI